MNKKGILLVNLGTPDSPSVADVRKYLDEFLMDPRVIDIGTLSRTLLVKGIIVPFRGPKSAKLYKQLWTENGSPLLYYGKRVKSLLQESLGNDYQVELAMRYQSPSIENALNSFREHKIFDIKVIPLFPQYASASTGSVNEKIMQLVSQWPIVPKINFVNSFYDNPKMIEAFAQQSAKQNLSEYDHVLFSFHGLPVRQLTKTDPSGCHCQKVENCCSKITNDNAYCYSAQSHHTAKLLAEKIGISTEQYTVCFQSRLGKEPWVEPYTTSVLKKLASEGRKKLLVFCPAFVADCLETIVEVSHEYHEEFKSYGGDKVQLVESLNDHPLWIEALKDMVLNKS